MANDNILKGENSEAQSSKPRRRWLKRTLIALGVILLLVIVAIAVVLCYLGPIVERYVEKNDIELIGRRLEMDDLSINLFKGNATVDNVILYEDDDTTPFAEIGRAELSLDIWDILDEEIHVTRAHFVNPVIRIDQYGERFNFDDMLMYIIAKYIMPEDDDDSEWQVTIENVSIEGGNLAYHDHDIDQRWELSDMQLSTPNIVIGNAMSHIDASMRINEVAQLEGKLDINCDNFDFLFDGSLAEFALADTYKYWTPYLNISNVDGIADATMLLEGNVLDIFSMNISGKLTARDFAISDRRGDNLLSTTTLSTEIEELNINAERYILRTLHAEGFATQMLIANDGTTNFDDLFYGEPEVSVETTTESLGDDMYDVRERVTITTTEEVAPFSDMTLRIGDMRLNGGNILFADKTMHKPFEYRLRNISIESQNFDLMTKNTLTLRANLQHQGSALIQWEGSLTDFYNQNLLAMLTNVDMRDFSPYVEHFTAFPVTAGNLTFRSQNVVTNGELSGVNNLGTHNFNVGKKDKSLDVEYNLPMKLGIFILTDNKQNISLDLPITGRIDSPEFSYRKIIMKAIGNVLLKVVAAPFAWMAGDKQNAFKHIDVDLLEAGFNAEHYARMDEMAAALKEDNTIKVRLTQRVNYDRARYRLADLDLKIAYYNSTQQNADERMDMLDFERIRQMRLSRKEVAAFADSQLLARGIDPSHLSSENKAMALYGDMVDKQLCDLMTHRNRIMREYMEFQHSDMPSEAFTINDVVLEDMKSYVGKDRYTVTLIIDDEEIELAPTEEEISDEQLDYYDAYILEDEETTAEQEGVEEATTEQTISEQTEERVIENTAEDGTSTESPTLGTDIATSNDATESETPSQTEEQNN